MPRFLDALFAPITRLLVARGILIAEAVERLKLHYIRAARDQAGSRPTDSRISVMTGLQRRDITRLLAIANAEAGTGARTVNHLSRLVALWQTDPVYGGKPLPRSGASASFEALAHAIRKDVHSRTMLEQLTLAGTVALDDQGRVYLLQHAYQPLAGSEQQLAYFADNAQDFLAAASGNILTSPAPFFERAVHYNGLSPEAVAELDQMFRDGQMALLLRMSAAAAERASCSPGRHRFRAGGYFYTTEET